MKKIDISEKSTNLPNEQLFTPDEVAERLKIDVKTVYNLCSNGTIEAFKIGGSIRIPREALVKYYEEGKDKLKPEDLASEYSREIK